MRILILSCNTGEGHNSCANALKEVFDRKGHYCVIEDSLSFISHTTSNVISNGHTIIYRHFPKLFRWGYRYTENHPSAYHEGSVLYRYFCSGKQRLADYINSGDFEVVICTHVFAGVMLTNAKKYCHSEFYTAFVGTDYTCSPTTEASDLDVYFVPDDAIKKEFIEYGISESKLVSSGIPVRQMFYQSEKKHIAKTVEGVNANSTHLLIMCGSMGCGPIDSLVFLLNKSLRENEEITVVCGTNKRMQKKLSKRYHKSSNIHIRGYVSDISRLMDSADLYLTKPGGISITEAKHKRLPMICVDAVAGCEEYNRLFFVERGTAVSEKNVIALSRQCITLLRTEDKRTEMRKNFDNMRYENSAQFICDFLNDRVLYRSSF